MYLQYKSFENTVGKGEIAHNDLKSGFKPHWMHWVFHGSVLGQDNSEP